MRLPCLKLATSLVLALGSASAFAGTVAVDTDTATAGIQANGTITDGGTRTVNLVFTRANAGEIIAAVSGTIVYDTTAFDVTSQTPACNAAGDTGQIPFLRSNIDEGLADGLIVCALTFTETGGANGDVEPITFTATAPPEVTFTPGQLTIQAVAVNPPTVNIGPGPINLPAGGNVGATSGAATIPVTAVGGTAPGAGSYSCTAPAGFQVTNLTNPTVTAGTDPADMSATCTLQNAAYSGTLACTRTGADATPVNVTLNCPAGAAVPAPAFTTAPSNGSTLNCSGTPGSTTTTQVLINNSGNAAATGVTCSTVGAGFAVQTQPSATINAGAASTVTVACTVPAAGVTNAGTLNCTSAQGGAAAASFPLSSTGIAGPTPNTVPTTIPSTSLWAKIGLVGLLAALGMLMVGFRRNH